MSSCKLHKIIISQNVHLITFTNISLLDTTNIVIYDKVIIIKNEASSNNIIIDISQLSAGFYNILVNQSTNKKMLSFIKN